MFSYRTAVRTTMTASRPMIAGKEAAIRSRANASGHWAKGPAVAIRRRIAGTELPVPNTPVTHTPARLRPRAVNAPSMLNVMTAMSAPTMPVRTISVTIFRQTRHRRKLKSHRCAAMMTLTVMTMVTHAQTRFARPAFANSSIPRPA